MLNGDFSEGGRWEGNCYIPRHWNLTYTTGEETATDPHGKTYETTGPEMDIVRCEHLQPGEPEQMCGKGEWVVKLFGGQRAFHTNFYQVVKGLEVGTQYRFLAPTFVDTYVWDGQKRAPSRNDHPTDRAARIRLEAEDGKMQHSEWFDERSVQNWFLNKHALAFIFTATASEMKVGVRSWCPWPIDNNGFFFEGFELTEVGTPPEEGVDYEVLVRVPAQNVKSFRKVSSEAEAGLNSVVPSHDDAGRLTNVLGPSGQGGLAILYDIPAGERQGYLDYYANLYPLARVQFAGDEVDVPWDRDITSELPRRADLEKWPDGRWTERELSVVNRTTNHHLGRLVESLHDMAAWYLTKEEGRPASPYTFVIQRDGEIVKCLHLTEGNWHDHSGKSHRHLCIGLNGALHEYPPTEEQFRSMVKMNAWAIRHPEMTVSYSDADRAGITGHDDWYRTECPGWRSAKSGNWKAEFYRRLDAEMGIEEPAPPPPEPGLPEPFEILSFQQQRNGPGRDEYIAAVKPDYWKLIHAMEEAHQIKAIHPGIKIIYRHVEDDWKQYVMAADKDAAARRFVRIFRDSLERNAAVIDYVEGLNEYIATNDYQALEQVSGWVEAYCAELARISYPARPVTFNTAVGNPQTDAICKEQGIPSQLAYMVGGVRATIAAGGKVAYHPYHGVRRTGDREYYCTLDGPERQFYSMRWAGWDEHWRQYELYPEYLFTERGTIFIETWGGMPNAMAGWKYENCYGGDMDWKIQEAIRRELQWRDLVREWNAQHGNRARCGLGFLHGGHGWELFDWEGEPGRRLAEAIVRAR